MVFNDFLLVSIMVLVGNILEFVIFQGRCVFKHQSYNNVEYLLEKK